MGPLNCKHLLKIISLRIVMPFFFTETILVTAKGFIPSFWNGCSYSYSWHNMLGHSYWIDTGNALCTPKSVYLSRSVAVLYVLEKS